MILARAICADSPDDLGLAFARMGLPSGAREYVLEKLPQSQVLLTGIGRTEGRFLKRTTEAQQAPGREEFPAYLPGDVAKRPGTALLSGRREQFLRLLKAATAEPELGGLAKALGRLLEPEPREPFAVGGRTFEPGRTRVMGVVNVTPDSFSDGGRFLDPERAIAHGIALAQAGADLLDIGGESTRPGAPRVPPDEEVRRIVPVILALKERVDVPISVDTTKAEVAQAALDAGASMVNDISGFGSDPAMAGAVARAGAACCLMHIQGTPQTMQMDPRYEDVVEEVVAFLDAAVARARGAGIAPGRISVDPGIGFGKTVGHNLVLLRRLSDLRLLNAAVVVGTSRKSFLGVLTGGKPAGERLAATLGSVAAVAALGAADFVRVHDVAEVKDALTVADAVRVAAEAGALFSR